MGGGAERTRERSEKERTSMCVGRGGVKKGGSRENCSIKTLSLSQVLISRGRRLPLPRVPPHPPRCPPGLANTAHIRQSRLDSGLDFQVDALTNVSSCSHFARMRGRRLPLPRAPPHPPRSPSLCILVYLLIYECSC